MSIYKVQIGFAVKFMFILLAVCALLAISACGGKAAGYIDREEATQIATNYKEGGELKSITFKTVDGIAVYSGTIVLDEVEYPFMIDAETGDVISFGEEEAAVQSVSSASGQSNESSGGSNASTPVNYIGEDAAEAVAMGQYPAATHVSTAISAVGDTDVYLITMDNGGTNVYIYVNALTGDIVDPNATSSQSSAQ